MVVLAPAPPFKSKPHVLATLRARKPPFRDTRKALFIPFPEYPFGFWQAHSRDARFERTKAALQLPLELFLSGEEVLLKFRPPLIP